MVSNNATVAHDA